MSAFATVSLPPSGPPCVVPDDLTNPDHVAAFERGWRARNAGRSRNANPWGRAKGTTAHVLAPRWSRGWDACAKARTEAMRARPARETVGG